MTDPSQKNIFTSNARESKAALPPNENNRASASVVRPSKGNLQDPSKNRLSQTNDLGRNTSISSGSKHSQRRNSQEESRERILSGKIKERIRIPSTTLPDETLAVELCSLVKDPSFNKLIQTASRIDFEDSLPKTSRMELISLPTREYLDKTVTPILMQALSLIAKERPPEPINVLVAFLLRNKSLYGEGAGDGFSTEKKTHGESVLKPE